MGGEPGYGSPKKEGPTHTVVAPGESMESAALVHLEVTLERNAVLARRGRVTLLATEEGKQAQLAVEVLLVGQVTTPQRDFPFPAVGQPGQTSVEQGTAGISKAARSRRDWMRAQQPVVQI